MRKLSQLLALPSDVRIVCDQATGEVKPQGKRQKTWKTQLKDWYLRTESGKQQNRDAVQRCQEAVEEDCREIFGTARGAQIARKVFNRHLGDHFYSGKPLTGARVRRVVQDIKSEIQANSNPSSIMEYGNEPSTSAVSSDSGLTPCTEKLLHTTKAKSVRSLFWESQLRELQTLSNDIENKEAQYAIKFADNLAFGRAAQMHFWERDSRVTIALNTNGEMKLRLTHDHSDPDSMSNTHRGENRAAIRVFKIFIAKKFGPLIARELWKQDSNLDVLFKNGLALRRSVIKDTIRKAQELQLQDELLFSRWADGEIPKARSDKWKKTNADNLKQFFDKAISFKQVTTDSRAVWGVVDEVLYGGDSEWARKLENKRTVQGFMDYLEVLGVDGYVRKHIWKTHFAPGFAEGVEFRCYRLSVIYNEAIALNKRVLCGDLIIAPHQADCAYALCVKGGEASGAALERIDSYLGWTKAITSRCESFFYWISTLGDHPRVPTDKNEVVRNQEQILAVLQYIKFHYSEAIAEDLWKVQLKDRYVVGMGMSSSEVIGFLVSSREKACSQFEEADREVRAYAKKHLRNSRANREELGLKDACMLRLRANFKAQALAQLWSRGSKLSEEEMRQIEYRCYAKELANIYFKDYSSASIRSRVMWRMSDGKIEQRKLKGNTRETIATEIYNNLVAGHKPIFRLSEIHGVANRGRDRVSDRIRRLDAISQLPEESGALTFAKDVWNGISWDRFSSAIHLLGRNGGNLYKYCYATSVLGFEDWARLYQLSLDKIKRDAYFESTSYVLTGEPQATGFVASTIGFFLEINNLAKARAADNENQHQYAIAWGEYRAAVYLDVLFKDLLTHYNSFAEGGVLPPREVIEEASRRSAQLVVESQNNLLAKYPNEIDRSYQWRHGIGAVLNVPSAACSVLFAAGATIAKIPETSEALTSAGRVLLFVGDLGLDVVAVPHVFFGAANTYREVRFLKKALSVKGRTQNALNAIYHERYMPVQPGDSEGPILQDRVFASYEAYSRIKKANASWSSYLRFWKWGPKNKANREMSDAMEADFAKSVQRAQQVGSYAINVASRSVGLLGSISCAFSAIMMVMGKQALIEAAIAGATAGAITGTGIVPFGGTMAGSIAGGFVSASLGIVSITLSLVLGSSYRYWRRKRNEEKIRQWWDACVHHEGPKWDLMEKAGMSEQAIEEFAFRKLIRRDWKIAKNLMALRLIAEHAERARVINELSGSSSNWVPEGPVTRMVKYGLKPHSDEKAKKDQERHVDNLQWYGYVDRTVAVAAAPGFKGEMHVGTVVKMLSNVFEV